jgi:zinc resistance-associated protein
MISNLNSKEHTMKKTMIGIIAIMAVAFLSTSAFSWGNGQRGCGGSGQGGSGYGQGYGINNPNAWNDLSKEQRDELTALQQKFIDETYEIRSAMMTQHQEMRLLMETSSPDRAKLETLSKAITDLSGQMRSKRIDLQLAAKKIAPELNIAGLGKRGGGYGGKNRNANCPRQARGYNQ